MRGVTNWNGMILHSAVERHHHMKYDSALSRIANVYSTNNISRR